MATKPHIHMARVIYTDLFSVEKSYYYKLSEAVPANIKTSNTVKQKFRELTSILYGYPIVFLQCELMYKQI